MSMITRIKAIGLVTALYSLISISAYTFAVTMTQASLPDLSHSKPVDDASMTRLHQIYWTFQLSHWLCVLNCMYFWHQIASLLCLKKMGRYFEFPTTEQLCDVALLVCSMTYILWFKGKFQRDLPDATAANFDAALVASFRSNGDFKFHYLFSVNVICLIAKIALVIQFNSEIGPLLIIV